MKILVTRSSENQTIGGAELSARDQALALKELGYTAVFSGNSRSIRRQLKSSGITSYRNLYLQRFRPPFRYLYFWLLLIPKLAYDLLLIFRIRPDLINPHTREDQISFTLTKFIHRRPVVWKDPGDMTFTLQPSTNPFGALYRNLYLAAARRSDHIYTLTTAYAKEIVDHLGDGYASRVSAIPSSILYSHYHVNPAQNTAEAVTIGSVCRLDRYKNIELLIRAYLECKDRLNQPSRLVIAGDGPQRAQLEALAAKSKDISFIGYVSDPSDALNSLDIFVHPATVEGWGRSIKEAMYFGKAIIGSRVGGIARQVDDGYTGILFESGNQAELVEAIIRLANDPDLRKTLGRNAAKKARDDGDFVDIVRQQIVPIYKAALEHDSNS